VETLARRLDSDRASLADAITARHYELNPELEERYGPAGREKCRQDAEFHLSYLRDAIVSDSPSLFADYVAWARIMLAARGIPAIDLARNLAVVRAALVERYDEAEATIGRFVDGAIAELEAEAGELESAIDETSPLGRLARDYMNALLDGDRRLASRLVLDAVDAGASVADVYLEVFQPVQHELGRLWQIDELSVAQEHFCTAATQLVMSQLYPRIFGGARNGLTLVATCVTGDLHEIGVRMISDFFEMEGWDTYYLGANAPTSAVVETLLERNADALAISATITSHVRDVVALVEAVRRRPECEKVKIVVGGYPFNVDRELWRRVGADGWARDAREAVAVAGRLVEGSAA
jgi:methanogenic corrinoid protein MtbC1